MSKNYYVLCDDDCKYLAMTKEQTLTAIEQAVATGSITDVDGAIISKIREIRADASISFWVGTEAQYNALGLTASSFIPRMTEDGTVYLLSDDSVLAGWKEEIYNEAVETIANGENLLYNSYFGYHGITHPLSNISEGWQLTGGATATRTGVEVDASTAGQFLYQDKGVQPSTESWLTIEWHAGTGSATDANPLTRSVVKLNPNDNYGTETLINGVRVGAFFIASRFHLQIQAPVTGASFTITALKVEVNKIATALTPSARDGHTIETTRALANEEALKLIEELKACFYSSTTTSDIFKSVEDGVTFEGLYLAVTGNVATIGGICKVASYASGTKLATLVDKLKPLRWGNNFPVYVNGSAVNHGKIQFNSQDLVLYCSLATGNSATIHFTLTYGLVQPPIN